MPPSFRKCGSCGSTSAKTDLTRCPVCYVEYDDLIKPISLIHWGRIVEWDTHVFITKKALEMFEDYTDPQVGEIIAVQGHGGHTLFFELAAYVEGWGEDPEPSFMLLRVDPDNSWPKDWPVLDVNPEDAVKLDGKKET